MFYELQRFNDAALGVSAYSMKVKWRIIPATLMCTYIYLYIYIYTYVYAFFFLLQLFYPFETRKCKENVGSFDKLVKPIRNLVAFFSLSLSLFFFFFVNILFQFSVFFSPFFCFRFLVLVLFFPVCVCVSVWLSAGRIDCREALFVVPVVVEYVYIYIYIHVYAGIFFHHFAKKWNANRNKSTKIAGKKNSERW